MAKMGKLTPEEEARNKMLLRERDRERKRLKRMNPEYRRMEQERDRDRKKARRANEAFRQLEKLRDKLRKERKKSAMLSASHAEMPENEDFITIPTVPVEPEIIISDQTNTPVQQQQQQPQRQQQSQQSQPPNANRNNNRDITINNAPILTNNRLAHTSNTTINSNNNNNNNNSINNATTTSIASISGVNTLTPSHLQQLNKSLLYPPPNFPHHPLPLASVALMPQLCHPILHQNLSASIYAQNGIKQEFLNPNDTVTASSSPPITTSSSASAGNQLNSNNSNMSGGSEEHEISLIEPEIILQTSQDIIAAPHHFQNHVAAAHTHHLHQQQCSMFQHMSPQAHMSMRAHAQLVAPTIGSTQHTQMHQYAGNKGS